MKKLLGIAMMALALAGCSKDTFKGKEYKLLNTEGSANITLGFDKQENRFYGSVINRYFGSYTTEGKNITFAPAGSTMMAGPQNLMMVEQEYLAVLPKVKTYELKKDKLTLTTEDNQVLNFEEIPAVKEVAPAEEKAPAAAPAEVPAATPAVEAPAPVAEPAPAE